jgi:hypothetical protein
VVILRFAAALALTSIVLTSRRSSRAIGPQDAAGPSPDRFPVLRRIDRARIDRTCPLAAEPTAAELEARARELTDQFWSELAWLTGNVPEGGWRQVTETLDRLATAPDSPPVTRRRMDC